MALLLIATLWAAARLLHGPSRRRAGHGRGARLFSICVEPSGHHPPGLAPDDLDLLVATGPGVPGLRASGWFLVRLYSTWPFISILACRARSSINVAALTFVQVYVVLMFVPHFGSHIRRAVPVQDLHPLFCKLACICPLCRYYSPDRRAHHRDRPCIGALQRPLHARDRCIC